MIDVATLNPGFHARAMPDKPAVVMADTGEVLTYRALDAGSARLVQWFAAQGLRRGEHVALFMENHLRFLEIVWALCDPACISLRSTDTSCATRRRISSMIAGRRC